MSRDMRGMLGTRGRSARDCRAPSRDTLTVASEWAVQRIANEKGPRSIVSLPVVGFWLNQTVIENVGFAPITFVGRVEIEDRKAQAGGLFRDRVADARTSTSQPC